MAVHAHGLGAPRHPGTGRALVDHPAALARPALIADIDGLPAAAISGADGRVVADPHRRTAALGERLRRHRSGWRPHRSPTRCASRCGR